MKKVAIVAFVFRCCTDVVFLLMFVHGSVVAHTQAQALLECCVTHDVVAVASAGFCGRRVLLHNVQ